MIYPVFTIHNDGHAVRGPWWWGRLQDGELKPVNPGPHMATSTDAAIVIEQDRPRLVRPGKRWSAVYAGVRRRYGCVRACRTLEQLGEGRMLYISYE